MGAGAKVLLLAMVLAAGVAATLWLVREPDAAPEPTPPATAAPSTHVASTPTRPVRARGTKAAAKPVAVEEDSLAPTKHAAAEVRVVGSVVDAEEKPIPAVLVRATRTGEPLDETKSDADGRFALRVGKRPAAGTTAVGVTALQDAAHAAFMTCELDPDSPDEIDLGGLELAAAIPLVARVEDAAGPVAGARVFVGTFFGTVFGAATTDARGVAKFDRTPPEDAWLFAYAKGRGRARGEIPDRRDPAVPLVLTLTSRTIRVAVVRTPPDEPLAGEAIAARLVTDVNGTGAFSEFVPPLDVAPTGAGGTTLLEDVGADEVVDVRRLHVETQPWRWTGLGRMFVEAQPRQTEVRIEVPSGRTIRWRILPGDVPPPPEGSVLSLRATSGVLPGGPSALRVEAGDLVGTGFGEVAVDAVAEAADGSTAPIVADRRSDRGTETTFRRPRSVEVVLRDERERPVAGAEITLLGRGRLAEPMETDGAGRVVFTGLDAGAGQLTVNCRTSDPPDERVLGQVDISKSDGRLEGRLPSPRSLLLRVTTEGRRELPPTWNLYVDERLHADPDHHDEKGEIRVSARPRSIEAPLGVSLGADGFRPVFVKVPPGVDAADMALDRGGTLIFETIPSPTVKPLVELHFWFEEGKRWTPATPELRRDDDGRRRYVLLAPGRYRLFDATSRVVGEPVEVTLGDAASTQLDLSRSGLVTGVVVGPDDRPVVGAWVDAEDAAWERLGLIGRQGPKLRGSSNAKGEFTVIVPGDRPLRLRAAHPLFKADPEKGVFDVVEPQGGVVLRLLDGPTIEFTVKPPEGRPAIAGARVFLFGEGEEPTGLPMVVMENGRFRAGGFEPGRAMVLVDPINAAPILFPDFELKDGPNDLGELRPGRGSTIRVRAPAAGDTPLMAQAWRVGRPKYGRFGSNVGLGEATIEGLGPGRFQVSLGGVVAQKLDSTARFVDVDGERDVVVDWPAK